MLKHGLLALMLAALIATVAASALAQSSDQPPAGGPPEHGRGHFDPTKRTEMLTKRLNLNSDQQAKVLEIFKSEQSQMEALHSDSSASQDDRRAKMMDLRKSTNEQVRALLDADQQKKFDKMEAEHGQWGHGPGGPPQQ